MNLIYQLGRLDKNMFLQPFKINGKLKEKELSSFALKEDLKESGEEAKVILIYPVSLPLNKSLESANFNDPDFLDNIKRIISNPEDEYLQKPREFFEKMPYSNEKDNFIIVHSIGEYLGVNFGGKFDDIVIEIFIDMIERYLKEEVNKIYIDISSGLNIYVSALLEAVRYFSTWTRLRNWIDSTKIPEIWITFSDPILGSSAKEYNLYKEKIEFKAFFTSPISKKDVKENNFSFVLKIYPNDRQKKRELRELLEKFVIIFSAIKNNVPIAVYHFGFDELGKIETVFNTLIEHTKSHLYASYKDSPALCKSSYSKAVLSLGFYMGFVEVLNSYEIKKYEKDKGVNLEEIKEKFENIYEKFGLKLNNVFMGNEISNTKEKIEKIAKIENQAWQSLINIHHPEKSKANPDKRNFFAHSGFEGNVTEIKMENNNLFVRYAEKYIDNNGREQSIGKLIKEWLEEEV